MVTRVFSYLQRAVVRYVSCLFLMSLGLSLVASLAASVVRDNEVICRQIGNDFKLVCYSCKKMCTSDPWGGAVLLQRQWLEIVSPFGE